MIKVIILKKLLIRIFWVKRRIMPNREKVEEVILGIIGAIVFSTIIWVIVLFIIIEVL